MKKSIITLAIIAITLNLNAQNVWQQIYNGYYDQTIFTQTKGNKFVMAGLGYVPMLFTWNVIQTDSVGDIENYFELWLSFNLETRCIEATSDSGYIISGSNYSVRNHLVKYDANNNIVWENDIKPANGTYLAIISMVVDSNDNIIATGINNGHNGRLIIMKINSLGDTLWTKNYFNDPAAAGQSIVESYDSGYYCLAHKPNASTLILKTDNSGDTLWTKTIDDSAIPMQITKTIDSCLIITANENNKDLVFIKTDKFGNEIWKKSYTTNNSLNQCVSIASTFDNGLITANYSGSYSNPDLWLMKLNENGDSVYTIQPSFSQYFHLRPGKIIQTADSLFVLMAFDVMELHDL